MQDPFLLTSTFLAKNCSLQRSASVPTVLPSCEDEALSVKSFSSELPMEQDHSFAEIPSKLAMSKPLVCQSNFAATRAMNSFLRRISGWVLSNEDQQAVEGLLDCLAGLGQGVLTGRLSMTFAYVVLHRLYENLPHQVSNNVVLTKRDLEVPRIMFRFAMAALGWPALNFFGKRKELISGTDGWWLALG